MRSNKSGRKLDYEPEVIGLVERLHEDIAQGSCVVFLGAGSTTDRPNVGGNFYRGVRKKSNYPETLPEPSFPKLMEYFCDELDGGHKNRLISQAISYIENFSLPGDDHSFATMLPNTLAEIPCFNRFVTTNWDPFLERSLDVLIPIVEDKDLGFWDDKKRQVLKIHGCITRPYSIVATETDYRECVTNNPLIFNKLRDLMATKTFIFIGYSLRDSDFQEVWSTITTALGRFGKLAYALNPNAKEETIESWRTRGVQMIKISDLQFVRCLRDRLEQEDIIPSRKFIEMLQKERSRIVGIHINLAQDSDGGMASSMYQDGLLHALRDVLSSTALGLKRNEDFETALSYAAKRARKEHAAKDSIEEAYWSGQREVLERFCHRSVTSIPAYFHPRTMLPSARFVQGRRWKN